MDMPDTTTGQDAYRAYRRWDTEAARELEIERLRDAYIEAAIAETGKGIFQDLATGLSFDDDRLHRQELELAWCSLMAFYGPQDKRLAYRNQLINLADRMAARMYQLIGQAAEKEAEKTIKEIESRSEF